MLNEVLKLWSFVCSLYSGARSIASAEKGVEKNVFAVSNKIRKTKSHKNIPNSLILGIDQRRILQNAMRKTAIKIKPNLFPKNLFLCLSLKFPTSGSLTPSQREATPIASPTSVPEMPITEVPKNIIKEPSVCVRELYPRPPIPYKILFTKGNLSRFFKIVHCMRTKIKIGQNKKKRCRFFNLVCFLCLVVLFSFVVREVLFCLSFFSHPFLP